MSVHRFSLQRRIPDGGLRAWRLLALALLCALMGSACSGTTKEPRIYLIDSEASWLVMSRPAGISKQALSGQIEIQGGECELGACQVVFRSISLTSVPEQLATKDTPYFELRGVRSGTLRVNNGQIGIEPKQLEFAVSSENIAPPLAARLSNPRDATVYLDSESGQLLTSFELSAAGDPDAFSVALAARLSEASAAAPTGTVSAP